MDDKRTHSVPLDTGDGEEVIEQQNMGSQGSRGSGEFPEPETPPEAPAPGAADLPGAPTGNETISEVIAEYEASEFKDQFTPEPDGHLRCLRCNKVVAADEVDVAGLRRVEGVSDPDDMAAIAALGCPNCGTKGTVVLKYGPSATPEEADVLRLLERERRSA